MNNIENNTSTNKMIVKKPSNIVAEAPLELPKHKLFSEKEANQKIYKLNNDIYEGTKKEKKKHDFNKSLFFKIFGILTLTTIGVSCFGKIKNFFRKS